MEEKNVYLSALETEQSGDWAKAHELVKDMVTAEAAWVHAYLHRVRGDTAQAAYWYNRAAQPECTTSLAAEWEALYRACEGIGRL